MPLLLRTATAADRESHIECGTLTFKDDPMNNSMFPECPLGTVAPQAIALGHAAYSERLATPGCYMPVVMDGEQVVGFARWYDISAANAMWAKEGDGLGTAPQEVSHGIDLDYRSRVAAALTKGRQDFLKSSNVWYLSGLGTHPEHQRRGIASMLMRDGIDKARKDNADIYIEASVVGMPLYVKFGAQVLGSWVVEGKGGQLHERVCCILPTGLPVAMDN